MKTALITLSTGFVLAVLAPSCAISADVGTRSKPAPAVASKSNATPGESHYGRLLTYQLTTAPNGTLANAWVVLRAEPEKTRPAPPGGQAASYPDSRWTVYTDIDGDSVFDAMVKVGPKQNETFILYRNTWIQVGDQMAMFTVGSVVRAKADGNEYVFKGHAWELHQSGAGAETKRKPQAMPYRTPLPSPSPPPLPPSSF